MTIPNGITLTNNLGVGGGIVNDGSIVIEPGGTFNNSGEFTNSYNTNTASTTVNGTFNNYCAVYFTFGTINISGIFNNSVAMIGGGPVTVNSGGTFNNLSSGYFMGMSSLTVNSGGAFNNSGRLSSSVAFNGGGNLNNSGILAPGNSPGIWNITGNYSASSTATHDFEVGGTATNQYDRLTVSGNLDLNGTLNVSLINGFTPTTGDLTIMTGTVNGTFSTVNIPSSYNLIYNSNSVVLSFFQTLPVTFVNLDAKKEDNSVRLHWNVGTEINVDRYEIERSGNGNHFSKIGFLKASGQNSYSFTDQQSSNNVFYRIKSVDDNGSYKYSSIIKVSGGDSKIVLSAFPSPARNQLTLQHSTANASSRIDVYSVDGKLLMTVVPEISNQQTTIDISSFKPGVYVLSYQDGRNRETLKVIKK